MPKQTKGKPAQQAADGKIPPEQDVDVRCFLLKEAMSNL
jgi:hypothetical protein